MSAEFIAVVLIMLLFIAFVALIIFSLSMSAGIRVRKDMLKLLESYDHLIDAKKKELEELRQQTEELNRVMSKKEKEKKPTPSAAQGMNLKMGELPIPSTYRQKGFLEGYQWIRKYFLISEKTREALVKKISTKNLNSPMRGEAALALRQKLTFDAVFELSKLSGEKQLNLLKEVLEQEDQSLLKSYLDRGDESDFSVLSFVDFLDDCISLESRIPRTYGPVSEKEAHNGICEGVQIRIGNRLYDYSISESEIY